MKYLPLLLVMLPMLVYAEPVVKHSGTTYLGCGSIGDSARWLIDPNDITTPKPGFIYLPQGCNSLSVIPSRYRKIVSGQVVEMSQAEKDAVDAPIIAAQQRQQAASDELAVNEVSTLNISQVNARIDQITDLTALKTFLKRLVRYLKAKEIQGR